MADARDPADGPIRVLVVAGTDAEASAVAGGLAPEAGLAVQSMGGGGGALDGTASRSFDCVVLDLDHATLDGAGGRDRSSAPGDAPVYVALVDPGGWASVGEYPVDGTVVPFRKPPPDAMGMLGDFIRAVVARHPDAHAPGRRRRLGMSLWELHDEVVDAPTQEEIIGVVCEHLAASEHFDAAWICGRPPETAPRASAGFDRERVERLRSRLEDGGEADAPWIRAASERESVVRSGIEFDTGRDGDGLAIASIPLLHRGIIYCVLTVVRNRSGDRADLAPLVDPLSSLGRAVGQALATTEMQAQSEIFQGAIEQAEPAIVILSDDGVVEYANTAFVSVYGHSKSEAVGSSIELLLPEGVDPASVLATVRDGTPWHEEISKHRTGGERFHVDLSIAPVLVEGGTRWKYVAVASDITSLKEREQRLQVLNRVLRHNLRNGLAVVRGNVEAAADRADESATPLLSAALEATDDLLATAVTAREVQSALGEITLQEQDLATEVKRVAARVREEFGAVAVTVSVPDSVPVTATDALADALWELLENACEHGSGPVEVAVDADDDRAVVEIADDGPGIPDHELSVIERGEETALEHGSGLGLWFAHWVVEGSGGELGFETDDGTTARVVLPVAEE